MRRRTITLLAATAMTLGAMAVPAAAVDVHEPHPHVLLVGVEMTEMGPTYRKCVDLAGGRSIPLNALHANVHSPGGVDEFGRGINSRGIRTAGHAVAPYTCETLPF
jgi:hypothetical protein